MSELLKLHTQELTEVKRALGPYANSRSRVPYDMIESNLVYPLNETVLRPMRERSTIYKHGKWRTPVLNDQLPIDSNLSVKQIKSILYNAIDSSDTYFASSAENSSLMKAQDASTLIDNIDNPHYNADGAMFCVHSPAFEGLDVSKPDWAEDGMLGHSEVIMEVAFAHTVRDVEFFEDHTFSSLLTGTKVWFAFPPTDENWTALQAHHKALAKGVDPITLEFLRSFKHGIVIVQQAGQVLIVPPFSMTMRFAPETDVSCTFRLATALAFDDRINHLKHFRLSNQLDLIDDACGQQSLIPYAQELIEDLEVILGFELPGCDHNKIISNICGMYETLRLSLRSLLVAVDDKAIVQGLENRYRAAWLSFLEKKRKKKGTCHLCDLRAKDMPSWGSANDRLRQHFVDVHCLRSER